LGPDLTLPRWKEGPGRGVKNLVKEKACGGVRGRVGFIVKAHDHKEL